MRVFKINTTAYEEEDFFLHTELDEQEIELVIQPIVNAERNGYQEYDNETILGALQKRYPSKKIELYVEFDTLTF
jgi:hypothetical protein